MLLFFVIVLARIFIILGVMISHTFEIEDFLVQVIWLVYAILDVIYLLALFDEFFWLSE